MQLRTPKQTHQFPPLSVVQLGAGSNGLIVPPERTDCASLKVGGQYSPASFRSLTIAIDQFGAAEEPPVAFPPKSHKMPLQPALEVSHCMVVLRSAARKCRQNQSLKIGFGFVSPRPFGNCIRSDWKAIIGFGYRMS